MRACYTISQADVCEYPNFRVRIEEAFRFEEDDTIVFNLSLINDTDEPIFYDPQLFGMQLRTEIYTASVVDASGTMPPHSTTVAFFAITGTPNGGRNNLAPANPWNVLITESTPITEKNPSQSVKEAKENNEHPKIMELA